MNVSIIISFVDLAYVLAFFALVFALFPTFFHFFQLIRCMYIEIFHCYRFWAGRDWAQAFVRC